MVRAANSLQVDVIATTGRAHQDGGCRMGDEQTRGGRAVMELKPLAWSLAIVSVVGCLAGPVAGDSYWYPLDRAELVQTAPLVQKDADAEALFWDVHVEDRRSFFSTSTELWHYLRIKIFTERGKATQGTVSLPYGGPLEIADVEGRTIKPNGAIVRLRPQEVLDRVIIRGKGLRIRVKSFVMPAVEPGAIIEYRWREIRHRHLSIAERFQFQRDIPARIVTYHFRPLRLNGKPAVLRTAMFNGRIGSLVHDMDGFQCTSMSNVPAYREEPFMPPEGEVKPWMLVFYADVQKTGTPFWQQYGRSVQEETAPLLKPTPALKQAAVRIVGDATREDEKLRRLYAFCHTEIRNVSVDATGLTEAEQKKLATDGRPSVTLKKRKGTAEDVNLLFAALTRAAGLEARIALVGDRSEEFFNPARENRYFLRNRDVAVRCDSIWRLHDPGNPYLPYGRLRWEEEGQKALVADAQNPFFLDVPFAPPDSSVLTRTAILRLTEDGALEGEARLEYTGHLAIEQKQARDGESPAQMEEAVRALVKRQVGAAEVSDIRIENASHAVAPIAFRFHLQLPGYAQVLGRRLFVSPSVFQHGLPPVFGAGERKHPVCFDYAHSEFDSVSIRLPDGMTLEHLPAPVSFAVADSGAYTSALRADSLGRVVFTRSFHTGQLWLPTSAFGAVKRDYNRIHEQDAHTLTVKPAFAESQEADPMSRPGPGR